MSIRLYIKGWNNVESVIKDVIVTNNTTVPTMDTTISEYLQSSFYANNLLKKLLSTIYDVIPQNDKVDFSENVHIYDLKNGETKFYPFLLDELNQFETLFREYFNSEYYVSESPGKENYDYLNFLSSMNVNVLDSNNNNNNNNYHILDFNYTRLSYIEKNVRNIHGRLADNNIIFGIDATKVDSDTPYYQFTKESRIMHNSLKSSLDKDILNKNIKEIKFFGHSLAEADYAYFQSIFDYLNIYDSDVILIFYYGSYLNVHKVELTEYEHQIQKLLSIYGTTLDNKDHGKNIMTKLMLENRLQIKCITSNY